jgi:hypothetical protein
MRWLIQPMQKTPRFMRSPETSSMTIGRRFALSSAMLAAGSRGP